MKNITLDGYEYILIYRQPTTMNVLCVYKIQKIQGANENPVYFLASSELREQCIRGNTFNKMKTYIMPQHYEGFFKDEFTAILMAKVVTTIVRHPRLNGWCNFKSPATSRGREQMTATPSAK